jgi:hypothetical protein
MAGRSSIHPPCWGSLTALIEPDGIDLFCARLSQLHVTHKWQWYIRVDPVDDDIIRVSPGATGGHNAAAGAPGPSPRSTGSDASWNVAGSTGSHTQAASSTLPPRPHQAVTPDAPGLSPGATGGHNAAAGAPGPSPGATAGLQTSYFPCWGSLTALAGFAKVTTPPSEYADA